MTYRWIIFAIAATILGGAAWYFGRPEMPKEPAVEKTETIAKSEEPAAPKVLPPALVEVVDLASAYEPVREPQSPSGIDPASFLEDTGVPSRIPYAEDEDNSPQVFGPLLLLPRRERIPVLPRLVKDDNAIRLEVMPREVK